MSLTGLPRCQSNYSKNPDFCRSIKKKKKKLWHQGALWRRYDPSALMVCPSCCSTPWKGEILMLFASIEVSGSSLSIALN